MTMRFVVIGGHHIGGPGSPTVVDFAVIEFTHDVEQAEVIAEYMRVTPRAAEVYLVFPYDAWLVYAAELAVQRVPRNRKY